MQKQLSAHHTPVLAQLSAPINPIQRLLPAHITPIDNQSQTAQTSAQIVRKKNYANITLSAFYTSHDKHKKKCTYHNRATGVFSFAFTG